MKSDQKYNKLSNTGICQSDDHKSSVVNNPENPKSSLIEDVNRRSFLGSLGSLIFLATSGSANLAVAADTRKKKSGQDHTPQKSSKMNRRRKEVFRLRASAARKYFRTPLPRQDANGDEDLYADYRASFFKTLPQNDLAEVDTDAYHTYLDALGNEAPSAFEAIPQSPESERGLANPQAAYSFELTGHDSHATRMIPAPAFSSRFQAAEMGEVYWQALTRDVPFREYEDDPLIASAIADLNGFSEAVGPKNDGVITPTTLFRGNTPGDLTGPYISQFLWLPVPYGISEITQKYQFPLPGDDFGMDYNEWLALQRGALPLLPNTFDNLPRHISNNRSLGEFVHQDITFQAYFNAALIIYQSFGVDALDSDNPYLQSSNQVGFVTFGISNILDLLTKVTNAGLKGAWFQKWLVHRRLRPELFGGRIENTLNGNKAYDIDSEILESEVVQRLLATNGNTLLPLAFPEGSPTHPSYPAGHAVIAGACTTVLKAFFQEEFVIPEPVIASESGLDLDAWSGEDLLLGNEINKLANNMSFGRDAAGVHYRSDGVEGIKVGEQVAISVLTDYSLTSNEDFAGFTLKKFDGTSISIVNGQLKRDGKRRARPRLKGRRRRRRFHERQ